MQGCMSCMEQGEKIYQPKWIINEKLINAMKDKDLGAGSSSIAPTVLASSSYACKDGCIGSPSDLFQVVSVEFCAIPGSTKHFHHGHIDTMCS